MSFIQTLFRSVFLTRRMTPEQVEEQEEYEVKTLLRAMISLDNERTVFPDPWQMQAKLRQFGQGMKNKDLLLLIEKCVRLGYMQKIGSTYPHYYVISPNGRNHLGLPGDKYE